jgi:hypothetical protein
MFNSFCLCDLAESMWWLISMSVRSGCESNVGTATFVPMEQMRGSGIITPHQQAVPLTQTLLCVG